MNCNQSLLTGALLGGEAGRGGAAQGAVAAVAAQGAGVGRLGLQGLHPGPDGAQQDAVLLYLTHARALRLLARGQGGMIKVNV